MRNAFEALAKPILIFQCDPSLQLLTQQLLLVLNPKLLYLMQFNECCLVPYCVYEIMFQFTI